MSMIFTPKEQDAVLPDESKAVQVMVVRPRLKLVFDKSRVHVTNVTATLSDAVPSDVEGSVKITMPVLWFRLVLPMYVAGHCMFGGWVSSRESGKLHDAVLPDVSWATQITLVTPGPNVEPMAGVQLTDWTATLSDEPTFQYSTLDPALYASVSVIEIGQVTIGGCESITVMLNSHDAVFPIGSVAVHVTGVTPVLKIVVP